MSKLAIDLGTTNTLVYVPNKGVVVNEPSVVAISAEDEKIVAIGQEAQQMIGKTPSSIIASHPLKDGAIASYRTTEAMIRHYINKASGRFRLLKPEVMVTVPAGISSTERRAVVDATMAAGAKSVFLIKEPIAAAIGAEIPIGSPSGNMIIDIGGGTSEVAVIALGDIVCSASARVGGKKMDEAIARYIREEYDLAIGEQTAEKIKKKIGAAIVGSKEKTMEVSGSNTVSSLPVSMIVGTNDVAKAVEDVLRDIIATVKSVLQETPPELAADVIDKAIVMSGGGSLLRRIDELLTKLTGVPCQLVEDPLQSVVKGAGQALENLDQYKESVLWLKEG
jgi:rod shape-determining protein MreB and related proteins